MYSHVCITEFQISQPLKRVKQIMSKSLAEPILESHLSGITCYDVCDIDVYKDIAVQIE